MKREQPATNLDAARRNRERIEQMRKREGPRYRFTEEPPQPTPTRRPFRRGIRGLRG